MITKTVVPCLTGKFGSWRFYNIIMKVKDLVNPITGVQTIPESKKIYRSDNLNDILQRLEDKKRIEPIKEYILRQQDRFFNSLTVAILGGDPSWFPIELKKDMKFEKKELDYLNLKFGILELSGKEELFIIDGQHRLLGLREAFKTDKNIGEEEVSVMLVQHEETKDGIKRLRRIFVSLNRNAKPVSEGENIILDEDDVSAILARHLVERYKEFKDRNVIAFAKNTNLTSGAKDLNKFTSMLALYKINELLLDNESLYSGKINGRYVRIRPSEAAIEKEYKTVEVFWSLFFQTFTEALAFVESPDEHKNFRTERGGLFFLRPIGQVLIARFYKKLLQEKKVKNFSKLQTVERYLDSDFWNYILFDPYKETIITRGETHIFNYLLYNLGYSLSENALAKLKEHYKKNSGDLKKSLPKPKYANTKAPLSKKAVSR